MRNSRGGADRSFYSDESNSFSGDRFGQSRYNDESSSRYNRNRYDGANYSKNRGRDRFKERDRAQAKAKPKEELMGEYQKRLERVEPLVSRDDERIADSQWGVRPKGFENVSAQRAKLSGLFPLPGQPRTVDFTKLEEEEREKLFNSNEVLNDLSRIDLKDSRITCTIIVKNIDFKAIDYVKVSEYFNSFLAEIDSDFTSLRNIEKKRLANDRSLIIEFKNNICATIAMALHDAEIEIDEISKDNHQSEIPPKISIKLQLERPKEYIVKSSTFSEKESNDIESEVSDTARKITMLVAKDSTESELIEKIEALCPLKAFHLLREKGTRESKGIAFLEFKIDENKYAGTQDVVSYITSLASELKVQPYVMDAFLSCLVSGRTSIQECSVDYTTLPKIIRGEFVNAHPKLKVIQLINVVTLSDLLDKAKFKFIEQDIHDELSKFGRINSIKIPRPANDFTPDLMQLSEPGVGRIYVEFEDEEIALNAIMGTAGRSYNDRIVLCAFYDQEDYAIGLL